MPAGDKIAADGLTLAEGITEVMKGDEARCLAEPSVAEQWTATAHGTFEVEKGHHATALSTTSALCTAAVMAAVISAMS
jgi:hypothetical protein